MNGRLYGGGGARPHPKAMTEGGETPAQPDGLAAANGRREALWLALAAAELCWVAPIFLALIKVRTPHPALYLWLGMLVLMLGYFYFYRALAAANLTLRLQQGVLVVTLVLSMVLVLRFHVYATAGLQDIEWFLLPLRQLTQVEAMMPGSWMSVMLLVYLWARAIHLANRSLSAESVGFSFRSGVVILVVSAFLIRLFVNLDMPVFVVAFFFFALVAVALARIEAVSLLPNSSPVPFSGFWIGTTVGAVAILALLGIAALGFLYAGGLRLILRLLFPVLLVFQILIAGLGVLFLMLIEWVLAQFSLDLMDFGQGLREALSRLGQLLTMAPPPSEPGDIQNQLLILGILQAVITIAIPAAMIALVVLVTWRRLQKRRGQTQSEETRESLLSAGAVARNLQAMLQSGLDRLGDLAGHLSRFGPGSRFLAAISIRRIYANVVRLATEAGYPRAEAQTPYEYLPTLCKALPGSEEDVATITEAYVNARYGLVPDSPQELQRIRDCWGRVEGRGSKKPERRSE